MRLGVIGNVSDRNSTSGVYQLEDKINYQRSIGNLQFYTYNSKSKNVGAQDTTCGDIFFSVDGTKCYVVGTLNNAVYQYTLSTPGDISTATYASKSFLFSAIDANVQAIYITPDGINFYIVAASGDRVYNYILTTPWDISTATQPYTYNVVSQVPTGSSTGVKFGDSGTKMYVLSSSTNEVVYQYNLSTAWDINTASYASKSLTVTTQDGAMSDITFSSDGTKLYALGDTNNTIYQYTLGTAWDVSTGTYASKTLTVTAQDTGPRGFVFSSDGTKGYIIGNTNNNVYQYTFSTAWDVSTGTYASKSFAVGIQAVSANAICFKSDGTSMYLIDDASTTSNGIYQYNLSTAWDISTASYASKFVSIYSIVGIYENTPSGLDISSDGKKFIFVGQSNGSVSQSRVFSFTLSNPWDVASTNNYFSPLVTSQDAAMAGISFKPDGTKVYLLGPSTGTQGVYQYTLQYPWNISSMTYDSIKLNIPQDIAPNGLVFNKTGTKLLVCASTNDSIYQYNLSTPWDISTASYIRSIEIPTTVGAAEGLVRGIQFSDDNSKLYVIGESLDTIYQYDIGF